MKKCKVQVSLIVLLTFLMTLIVPAAPAYAFSVKDAGKILSPAVKDGGKSTNLFINIIIALLLGSLINKATDYLAPDSSGSLESAVFDFKAEKDSGKSIAKGQAILDTAKTYMFTPYVWGGVTPEGWDCSGFTQYVMRENGIKIPRTAEEQFNFKGGASILKSNLKVGDMVFFATYKPQASHVGFYMGDGKFIHASSAEKKVIFSSLDEPYFKERYLGARRYE